MWRVWQAYLDGLRGVSFPKLVEEAFLLFHALFRDKLLQVIPTSSSCSYQHGNPSRS